MRALQKRNAQAGRDTSNLTLPEDLQTVEAALPCYVYSKATGRVVDGDKTATIEQLRALIPLGSDVQAGDVFEPVSNRLGAVIHPGPLIIQGVQYRLTHLEARFKDFNQ